VAGWISGGRDEDGDSPLSRGIVAALVRDLVRSATATCPVEPTDRPPSPKRP